MTPLPPDTLERISKDLSVPRPLVEAVVELIDAGATAPFLARYRRNVIGGLVEAQIRAIRSWLSYERDGAERSSRAATKKNAAHVRTTLLAPPLGEKSVIGIMAADNDEYHCVMVDGGGQVLEHSVVALSEVGNTEARARMELLRLLRDDREAAFAIAQGDSGRKAERFIGDVIRDNGLRGIVATVSSAGATAYGSSAPAQAELGDLEPTMRAAVSIARRLQDPLTEIVRIGPRVVFEGELPEQELEEVVESCVNFVGLDLNRANTSSLRYIAGLGPQTAAAIVAHRQEHGAFAMRQQLLDVAGMDAKTFEQAAGFLRVRGGPEPLDATAVHPERYELVVRIASDHGMTVTELIGQSRRVAQLEVDGFVSDGVGRPTLDDILAALEGATRDPRGAFERSKKGERSKKSDWSKKSEPSNPIADLKAGVTLDGVVTKVTEYGAFVNIGSQQDGLVHVSQLADRFVKDPNEVVSVGDSLSVRVLEVDRQRGRISLSARSENAPVEKRPAKDARRGKPNPSGRKKPDARPRGRGRDRQPQFTNNPFADLKAKLKLE